MLGALQIFVDLQGTLFIKTSIYLGYPKSIFIFLLKKKMSQSKRGIVLTFDNPRWVMST